MYNHHYQVHHSLSFPTSPGPWADIYIIMRKLNEQSLWKDSRWKEETHFSLVISGMFPSSAFSWVAMWVLNLNNKNHKK